MERDGGDEWGQERREDEWEGALPSLHALLSCFSSDVLVPVLLLSPYEVYYVLSFDDRTSCKR